MTTEEKIQLVTERFFHRKDTFAIQWHDENKGTGYYPARSGKCNHNPRCSKGKCPDVALLPLDKDVILKHLQGRRTLGVYQLAEDNTVRWGWIDVDGKKVEEQQRREYTLAIAKSLAQHIGKRFLVEDSGNKGYHLWVFFETPVEAKYVTALLRDVVKHVDPMDGLTTEVFPKQTNLHSFGNLVKLPLGIHQKTEQRCFFVNGNFEPHADQWDVLSRVPLLTQETLLALTKDLPLIEVNLTESPEISKFLQPCMHRMMTEGIGEGGRDEGMFRIACHLRSQGLNYDMAMNAMLSLNQLNRPPLTQDEVETKTQSAFSSGYKPLPCMVEALDSFFSSSCPLFAKKCEGRGYSISDAKGRISRE